MQPITSGTSRERIIRTALLTLLVTVFAGAFLRDGYGGYARKNAAELAASLGLSGDAPLVINEKLTKAEGLRLASNFTGVGGLAGVRKLLGEPAVERENAVYFVGPGGNLQIEADPGRAGKATWVDGGRSETSQAIQRGVGYLLAVVTIAFAIQLLRVLSARTTLCDAGLKVPGHPLIELDAIQTMRVVGERGAAVELGYAAGDQTETILLDPYFVGRLEGVVAAISQARGIENPLAGTDRSHD